MTGCSMLEQTRRGGLHVETFLLEQRYFYPKVRHGLFFYHLNGLIDKSVLDFDRDPWH
jgi:hypothetical protein